MKRAVVGWLAVVLATGLSSFWAFWGIIENFHEGWYSTSLGENLGMMLFQYLAPCLIFVALTLLALRWPLVGGSCFLAACLALRFWLFSGSGSSATVLILVPMALLGALFAFGRPTPIRWAYRVAVVLPLVTLVVAGIQPCAMVAARDKTVELGQQTVNGLVWAQAGPGWPERGASYAEAKDICAHLSPDGRRVMSDVQNVWRLPTVNEVTRSATLHRRNAGGVWNPVARVATYRITPDKEAPLWNPHSRVIYWWTATEASADQALIVVYHGGVYPRKKTSRWDYLAFRAVRDEVPRN